MESQWEHDFKDCWGMTQTEASQERFDQCVLDPAAGQTEKWESVTFQAIQFFNIVHLPQPTTVRD